jgi:hypothetical protein
MDPNDEFADRLSKDFTCETACRIKLISAILSLMGEGEELPFLQKLNQLNLWKSQNKVNEIILDSYKEWKKLWSYESMPSIDVTDAM